MVRTAISVLVDLHLALKLLFIQETKNYVHLILEPSAFCPDYKDAFVLYAPSCGKECAYSTGRDVASCLWLACSMSLGTSMLAALFHNPCGYEIL